MPAGKFAERAKFTNDRLEQNESSTGQPSAPGQAAPCGRKGELHENWDWLGRA